MEARRQHRIQRRNRENNNTTNKDINTKLVKYDKDNIYTIDKDANIKPPKARQEQLPLKEKEGKSVNGLVKARWR